MNYTFKRYLPIYDKAKELVARIIEDSDFNLMEAKNYHDGDFMGYNLLLYYNGEYTFLETYEYENNCSNARLAIEKAYEENQAAVYLEEE